MTTWTWASCITYKHEHMRPIHSYVSHKYMCIQHTGTHVCMSIHMHYIHSSMHYQLNHIHTRRCSAWIHKVSSLARMHEYHMHACTHIIIYIRMHAHVSHDAYLHMCCIHEWSLLTSWNVVHTCKCIRCMHAQALHTIIACGGTERACSGEHHIWKATVFRRHEARYFNGRIGRLHPHTCCYQDWERVFEIEGLVCQTLLHIGKMLYRRRECD